MDKNVWYLVTKSSSDGTLRVGNVVKVDDLGLGVAEVDNQGFVHFRRVETLPPDAAIFPLR